MAGRLAQLLVGGDDVEDVVDDLERHAVGPAEAGEEVDLVAGEVAGDGADAGRPMANRAAVFPSIERR